jgi:hypothetical protein
MDEVTIPMVKLPNGFIGDRFEMVITGYCNQCSKKIPSLISGKFELSN